MPELPPNAKPGSANGLCQPLTTSYGLGPDGPVIVAGVWASSVGTPAASASSAADVTTVFIITVIPAVCSFISTILRLSVAKTLE